MMASTGPDYTVTAEKGGYRLQGVVVQNPDGIHNKVFINSHSSGGETTMEGKVKIQVPENHASKGIYYDIIKNDGESEPKDLIRLLSVKELFKLALPKMPAPYISRLVFDLFVTYPYSHPAITTASASTASGPRRSARPRFTAVRTLTSLTPSSSLSVPFASVHSRKRSSLRSRSVPFEATSAPLGLVDL